MFYATSRQRKSNIFDAPDEMLDESSRRRLRRRHVDGEEAEAVVPYGMPWR